MSEATNAASTEDRVEAWLRREFGGFDEHPYKLDDIKARLTENGVLAGAMAEWLIEQYGNREREVAELCRMNEEADAEIAVLQSELESCRAKVKNLYREIGRMERERAAIEAAARSVS